VSPDELADAYWEHYRLRGSEQRDDRLRADAFFWAYEMVDALVKDLPRRDLDAIEARAPGRQLTDPIDRLDLIVLLADRAPDGVPPLSYLGAGPVEDYLQARPNVARVDELARRSSRFRIALRCAWFDQELPPDDAARLRRHGDPL
jgi:hypothetical protein